ncbi:MAG: acyl-CoA dehydrogenase [Deltaproteobacteria bacterium]|nr:acyl-CoA dehydrogenase [Deltaproteobacteria bacterium]
MNFDLTEEQRMIREMVRDFAERELQPVAGAIDREHRFPAEQIQKMAELGLMGIVVPPEYGGAGMDYVCYVIATEEVARVCASTSAVMSAHNSLCIGPIMDFGTEEQKKRWVIPLAQGQKLGSLGMTEANAGSDAAGTRTTAERSGDEWVINGTKNFITNGREADVCCFIAVTEKGKGHRGITMFVVEKGAPGFSVGKVEDKLGIRGSSTVELVFDNCRIPADHLLGNPGEGFKIALHTLDGGRIGIAAQAVGIAQGALDASIPYAEQRVQFDQPIAHFQAIQWMIADMATTIDAARLLTYRAACLKNKGEGRYTKEASMAKLFASEVAMKITTQAIQIHGGYGYTTDYPVERFFRDAKITEIYEGTSEIQRLVIAANILNLKKKR